MPEEHVVITINDEDAYGDATPWPLHAIIWHGKHKKQDWDFKNDIGTGYAIYPMNLRATAFLRWDKYNRGLLNPLLADQLSDDDWPVRESWMNDYDYNSAVRTIITYGRGGRGFGRGRGSGRGQFIPLSQTTFLRQCQAITRRETTPDSVRREIRAARRGCIERFNEALERRENGSAASSYNADLPRDENQRDRELWMYSDQDE